MSSSKNNSSGFLLNRFLISFSGTVAIAVHSGADQQGSETAMHAAVFKISNGLVLATLDTSRNIKPSEIKVAERMVNNLIAGFESDLGFEQISDEIYEAAGSKVVFLLTQRHYPIIKKGALSWLIEKAIFRAKLSAQKTKSTNQNNYAADSPDKPDEQYIADFNAMPKDKFRNMSQITKGHVKLRIN